jgi:hypothetical protein
MVQPRGRLIILKVCSMSNLRRNACQQRSTSVAVNLERPGEACTAAFVQHPGHEIITSFPGLGDLIGARILAGMGDDRSRA